MLTNSENELVSKYDEILIIFIYIHTEFIIDAVVIKKSIIDSGVEHKREQLIYS